MTTNHFPEVRKKAPAVAGLLEHGVRPGSEANGFLAFADVLSLADKAGMWWPMGGDAGAINERARIGEFARLVEMAERERWLGMCEQALDALEYHKEQTRPIDRTDAAIAALRKLLGGCVYGGPNV